MGVSVAGLLPWRELGGIAAVAAASAVPAEAVRSATAAPLVVRLALTGVVFATAYLVLLFHSGLLAESEKRALTGRLAAWPLPAAASESPSRS
jgi:hypothetical protein